MEIYFNREHLLREVAYPNRYQPQNLVKSALVVFSVTLVFLLLFKPFGPYEPEQKMNYFMICALHALSPAVIWITYFWVLNYVRANYQRFNKWTLFAEYSHIGIVILLAGLGSFLMRDLIYTNADNWSWRYFWEELRNCFAAGVFFYFLLRLISFYLQSKKDSPLVIQFKPFICQPIKGVVPSSLAIKTQVKQDDFSLDPDTLLFAKADGNYIELTTCCGNEAVTELKRISLTQFEAQVSGYANFFRCHRAYLVNMLHVEKVSGNSQGYLLAFNNTETKIPVSRSQLDNFNSVYQRLRVVYSA